MRFAVDSAHLAKRAIRVLQGREIWQSVQLKRKSLVLGNRDACWRICPAGIGADSVVYSVGVGEEISFDLDLIRRFGVRVHAFDPTPRSIHWLQSQNVPAHFLFHPWGICDFDGVCSFQPPRDPTHVSHTILNRKSGRPSIEVPVYRLRTIMKLLGHRRVTLLKMDIEGAEYAVLDDLLSCGIEVDQLLVEFHHRWPEVGVEKTKTAIRRLNEAGYRIFTVSPSGEEYGFLKASPADHALFFAEATTVQDSPQRSETLPGA